MTTYDKLQKALKYLEQVKSEIVVASKEYDDLEKKVNANRAAKGLCRAAGLARFTAFEAQDADTARWA